MKKHLLTISAVLAAVVAAQAADKTLTVTVTNPSKTERKAVPVVIEVEELVHKLEELPPMDEASFKAKISDIIGAYTKGKDAATLRIVVKRKESED